MSQLSGVVDPGLPRAVDPAAFRADPFAFLGQARAAHGDRIVLRDGGPMFSRDPACPGVVAVFGAELRTVLDDLAVFGMPVSAARQLGLPANVVNLTRGLHTMIGDDHAAQRRIVGAALGDAVDDHAAALAPALDALLRDWQQGAELELLAAMRGLAVGVAGRLLFGTADRPGVPALDDLVELLDTFFVVRREVSAGAADAAGAPVLAALGESLDAGLRAYVRAARAAPGGGGICDRLAASALGEDAIVAHLNVLFVSSTEPVAVALTWILLVLSQQPALRAAVRRDVTRGGLLDRVISECLRLLPPNAMMARVTTQPVRLGDAALPTGTELVLCPFVVHRDPVRFPEPSRFSPARWSGARPSSFDYLPFGAGGHGCAGRALALALLRSITAAIVVGHDLVLAGEQAIDWRLHIQLLPRVDPIMQIRSVTGGTTPGAAWRGAVADLVQWASLDS